MPKHGCLFQLDGHTIEEFYKISISDINVRCKIPSFTDLLFIIFGAFLLNIVPFLFMISLQFMFDIYFLCILQINPPSTLYSVLAFTGNV